MIFRVVMAQNGHPNPPFGEDAVGTRIARTFGEQGMFYGSVSQVKQSRNGRGKTLYHIKYDDGDEEDLDAEEYQYAFELNLDSPQACDEGSSSNEKEQDITPEISNSELSNPPPPPGTFLAPTWTNLIGKSTGKRRAFQPVISRADLDEKMTKPKFKPPCPGSDDISPDTFCRVFFTDEDITKIARYSEKYRVLKAVSSSCPPLFSLFTHPSQQPRRFKRAKVGISSADVTMFFAITIYMGVVRLPSMEAYWNHGDPPVY